MNLCTIHFEFIRIPMPANMPSQQLFLSIILAQLILQAFAMIVVLPHLPEEIAVDVAEGTKVSRRLILKSVFSALSSYFGQWLDNKVQEYQVCKRVEELWVSAERNRYFSNLFKGMLYKTQASDPKAGQAEKERDWHRCTLSRVLTAYLHADKGFLFGKPSWNLIKRIKSYCDAVKKWATILVTTPKRITESAASSLPCLTQTIKEGRDLAQQAYLRAKGLFPFRASLSASWRLIFDCNIGEGPAVDNVIKLFVGFAWIIVLRGVSSLSVLGKFYLPAGSGRGSRKDDVQKNGPSELYEETLMPDDAHRDEHFQEKSEDGDQDLGYFADDEYEEQGANGGKIGRMLEYCVNFGRHSEQRSRHEEDEEDVEDGPENNEQDNEKEGEEEDGEANERKQQNAASDNPRVPGTNRARSTNATGNTSSSYSSDGSGSTNSGSHHDAEMDLDESDSTDNAPTLVASDSDAETLVESDTDTDIEAHAYNAVNRRAIVETAISGRPHSPLSPGGRGHGHGPWYGNLHGDPSFQESRNPSGRRNAWDWTNIPSSFHYRG
ncbi:hypothetical protein ABEF95_011454 [Exophiala dermatitidis]